MPQPQAFWHLENIDVTHLLCPTKLGDEALMAKHSRPTFKKGEQVYVPQDQSDRIFFINEGRIKISVMNDDGKEVTKAILGRGEVFVIAGLDDGNDRVAKFRVVCE